MYTNPSDYFMGLMKDEQSAGTLMDARRKADSSRAASKDVAAAPQPAPFFGSGRVSSSTCALRLPYLEQQHSMAVAQVCGLQCSMSIRRPREQLQDARRAPCSDRLGAHLDAGSPQNTPRLSSTHCSRAPAAGRAQRGSQRRERERGGQQR